MNQRPHQEDELDARLLRRPRTFDVASNGRMRGGRDAFAPLTQSDYTIAWICALPLELAASRAMLDEEHRPLSITGDENAYVLGRIDQHNVVMACLPGQYGMNNAAIVATNLKRSFPGIRATLMVGIGGGAPGMADLRLGDVVVGTRVMQYDMGKVLSGDNFRETADAKIPAWLLNSAISIIRSKNGPDRSNSGITSFLRSRLPTLSRPTHPDRLFQASYDHLPGAPTCDGCDPDKVQPRRVRLSDEPKVHYGGIASGNRVMKNAKTRDDIAQRLSVLCFEMEAAGMMDNLHCLPIRGICDYSDSHKNKEWQDYAAATAVAYARALLEALPPALGERGCTATWVSPAGEIDTVGMPNFHPLASTTDRSQLTAHARNGGSGYSNPSTSRKSTRARQPSKPHIAEPVGGSCGTRNTGIGSTPRSSRRIMASCGCGARQAPESRP